MKYLLKVVFTISLINIFYYSDVKATIYKTIQSGDWSDPAIWDLNSIPTAIDTVEIRHNVDAPTTLIIGTNGLIKVNIVGTLFIGSLTNNNRLINEGIIIGDKIINRPGARFVNHTYTEVKSLINEPDGVVLNFGTVNALNKVDNNGMILNDNVFRVNLALNNFANFEITKKGRLVVLNALNNEPGGHLEICGTIGLGVLPDQSNDDEPLISGGGTASLTNDGTIEGCEGGIYAGKDGTLVTHNNNITGVVYLCLGSNSTYENNSNVSTSADFILSCCFLLKAHAGPNKKFCAGIGTIIGGNPTARRGEEPYQYTWTPNIAIDDPTAANPGVSPTVPTKYYVNVQDATGCEAIDSVVVTPTTQVIARAGLDFYNVCEGESTRIGGEPSAICGTGDYTYSWSPATFIDDPAAPNPTVTPDKTTIFVLIVTDAGGFTSKDSTIVFVDSRPVDANAGPDQVICQNTTTLEGNSPPYGFGKWEIVSGTATIEDQFNPNSSVSDLRRGESVTLRWLTVNGDCIAEDDVLITVSPQQRLITQDTEICSGNTVRLQAEGGENYIWSPADGLDNPNIANPTATPNETTTYSVNLETAGCPTVTFEATITVNPLPVVQIREDTVILAGESIELFANGGSEYLWSPAEGLNDPTSSNPIAQPTTSTTYEVEVTSDKGCKTRESVTIGIDDSYEIFVPEMFTPNGDGTNDLLFINTIGIKSIEFKVFDRNGKLLFKTNDSNQGWNGKYQGLDLGLDTYVYLVVAKTMGNQTITKKGAVQLMR